MAEDRQRLPRRRRTVNRWGVDRTHWLPIDRATYESSCSIVVDSPRAPVAGRKVSSPPERGTLRTTTPDARAERRERAVLLRESQGDA